MDELEKILRIHAKMYPEMQPADAVKLIYQNEFGGGHLIRDKEACRNYLHKEYVSVEHDPASARYTEIGNQIIRVNLSSLSESELDWLGNAFIRSAWEHTGSLETFLGKLQTLRQLTQKSVFGFSVEQLEIYLREYEAAGFPAVSHSLTYRKAYSPAYRIILKKYAL